VATHTSGGQVDMAELMVGFVPGLEKVHLQILADLEELIGQCDIDITIAALHDLDHLRHPGRGDQM